MNPRPSGYEPDELTTAPSLAVKVPVSPGCHIRPSSRYTDGLRRCRHHVDTSGFGLVGEAGDAPASRFFCACLILFNAQAPPFLRCGSGNLGGYRTRFCRWCTNARLGPNIYKADTKVSSESCPVDLLTNFASPISLSPRRLFVAIPWPFRSYPVQYLVTGQPILWGALGNLADSF